MANKAKEIIQVYENNRSLSNKEIAEIVGTSNRHVRRTLNPIRREHNSRIKNLPKILILDIETMFMTASIWFLGKQRIPYQNVRNEWNMLSWSAKWLFFPNIMSDIQTPEEAINRDDKRIVKSIVPLLEEADIIIGHNLRNFDMRKINARLLYYRLPPISSYQIIDTLKELKRYFSLSSYKLDDVNKFLGIPTKKHTGYELWQKCLVGDQKALNTMLDYNENDTRITEDLYLIIRPWIKSHPNCALYSESVNSVCPNCGCLDMTENGKYYTPAGRFISYRCDDCGAICRSRYSDLTKEDRQKLLISTAR